MVRTSLFSWAFVVALLAAAPAAGRDLTRSIEVDGRARSYLVHLPKRYDGQRPTPVVLALHPAGTNAQIMVAFSGLNEKADRAGFVAVYPNGTGVGPFLTFNAGGITLAPPAEQPDDVRFIAAVLDDLETVVNVDRKRIFATGMSNGGMMCHRLAAELSERIAAIATVSGTLAVEDPRPARPVPVLHFHGTADWIVPYDGPGPATPPFITFLSVPETIQTWVDLNQCQEEPVVERLPNKVADGTFVIQETYLPQAGDAEVILLKIQGGGHTWPGRLSLLCFLGRSTLDVSANDRMWEFFKRHPLP